MDQSDKEEVYRLLGALLPRIHFMAPREALVLMEVDSRMRAGTLAEGDLGELRKLSSEAGPR